MIQLAPCPRVTCGGYTDAGNRHHSCSRVIQEGDPQGEHIVGLCFVCRELQRQADAIRTARKAHEVEWWAGNGHAVEELTAAGWDALTRGR